MAMSLEALEIVQEVLVICPDQILETILTIIQPPGLQMPMRTMVRLYRLNKSLHILVDHILLFTLSKL